MSKTAWIFILMAISVILSAHGPAPDVDFTRQTAHVVWVFDGDTIVVTLPGKLGITKRISSLSMRRGGVKMGGRAMRLRLLSFYGR